MQLNQKIVHANHAHALVSTLAQEIIMLRQDATSLLKAQSIPRPPPFKGSNTEEIFIVLEAEAPAETCHHGRNSPTRQVRKTMMLEHCLLCVQ